MINRQQSLFKMHLGVSTHFYYKFSTMSGLVCDVCGKPIERESYFSQYYHSGKRQFLTHPDCVIRGMAPCGEHPINTCMYYDKPVIMTKSANKKQV